MAVYHIGRDGMPHRCRAKSPDNCPLGGIHFQSMGEAQRELERQAAEQNSGMDVSYNKNADVTSWSEPRKNELLVYGTPNRTYDSTASFLSKLPEYDKGLRALGATPVANLEGKWKQSYERSVVYSVPMPGTEQGYEKFRSGLRDVVERFNQDSILIVRRPFKGEGANATSYCFDGVTPEQAHKAASVVAFYRKRRAEGGIIQYSDLTQLETMSYADVRDIVGTDDEYWSFGSSYRDSRFATFGIDEYQDEVVSSDYDTLVLGRFFNSEPSRRRLVLDEVTPMSQEGRPSRDEEVRREAEDLGLIDNESGDDIYRSDSSNTEAALKDWRNYGRQETYRSGYHRHHGQPRPA